MSWPERDRKSTRLNSSHMSISYAVFCLKKKKKSHMLISYAVFYIQKKKIINFQIIKSYCFFLLFVYLLVFLFCSFFFFFFFFNDTATTEIYTLSLHDALPI